MKKEVSLSDERYFEIFIGKRVLKSEVFNSKGNIPLYSANVFEPFGFLNDSNINDFSHDCLLWGIDGNFEFKIMRKRREFATTDHCGVIRILNTGILPEYLLHALELQSHALGFDRTLRPSLAKMRKVTAKIPINEFGQFDKTSQKEITQKYISIKKIKEDLRNEIDGLSNITIEIDLPKEEIISLRMEDIFDLSKTTNNSKFTKSFVDQNKGNIPVYSASKEQGDINYGFVKDNLPGVKYFENILTWNIDGSIGKPSFRKGRFSLSEKVIPLILKEKWKGRIDYIYVKHALEKKAVERGFTFTNKAGKSRLRDVEIEIPVNQKGEVLPDIKKQKELAKKYDKLYEIKEKVIEHLQDLHDICIEI